jgi:hypothetical protein
MLSDDVVMGWRGWQLAGQSAVDEIEGGGGGLGEAAATAPTY